MKRLLEKTGSSDGKIFSSALLEWSCTPRADGYSPAEAFFGRRPRSRLPSARSSRFDRDEFETSRALYRERMVEGAHGRLLQPLVVGQRVHVQDVSERSWSFGAGTVIERTLVDDRTTFRLTQVSIAETAVTCALLGALYLASRMCE